MRKIDQLLSEYGESHKNAFNKKVHWICVPLIFWSIVALIASIPSGFVNNIVGLSWYANWAGIALFLVAVYYFRLSFSLAIGMLLFAAFCLWSTFFVNQHLSQPLWMIAIIVFVLAWIGQFYGHKIEGKKPSFLKDLQFLLIGPAWLMHFIYKKIGLRY